MIFQPELYKKVRGTGGHKRTKDARTVEQRVLDRIAKKRRYDAAEIVADTFVGTVG